MADETLNFLNDAKEKGLHVCELIVEYPAKMVSKDIDDVVDECVNGWSYPTLCKGSGSGFGVRDIEYFVCVSDVPKHKCLYTIEEFTLITIITRELTEVQSLIHERDISIRLFREEDIDELIGVYK